MPVVTINDLPSIPSLGNSDVLPIVGVSTNTTYKVTKQSLLDGLFPYTGSAIITGSLQVIGPIQADVLRVSVVSSSIVYSSGSNIFGDATTDNQQMTGSVTVSGSLSVTGPTTLNVLPATSATILAMQAGGNARYFFSVGGSGEAQIRTGNNVNLTLGVNEDAITIQNGGSTVIQKSLAVGLITPSATTGRIDAANDVVAFSTSDANYKKNVSNIQNALQKVKQINGVEFDWIENIEVHGNSGHDVGVIAQEIERVLPEVVTTRENGVKAVKYEKIVSLLIEAIKDLEKQVEELKTNK